MGHEHDRDNNQRTGWCDDSAVTTARQSEAETAPFSCQEWIALLQLRRRYQAGHDLWSACELEHLRFHRWRYATGQVES